MGDFTSVYLESYAAQIKNMELLVYNIQEKGVKLPKEAYDGITSAIQKATDYLSAVVANTSTFSKEKAEELIKNVQLAWEKYVVNNPKVIQGIEIISPHVVAGKDKTIEFLTQVKESKQYQTYIEPTVEKVVVVASNVKDSAKYQKYVAPRVDQIVSSEYYAIMQKRVAALAESLKHSESLESKPLLESED